LSFLHDLFLCALLSTRLFGYLCDGPPCSHCYDRLDFFLFTRKRFVAYARPVCFGLPLYILHLIFFLEAAVPDFSGRRSVFTLAIYFALPLR
jgi:hypothetical protein